MSHDLTTHRSGGTGGVARRVLQGAAAGRSSGVPPPPPPAWPARLSGSASDRRWTTVLCHAGAVAELVPVAAGLQSRSVLGGSGWVSVGSLRPAAAGQCMLSDSQRRSVQSSVCHRCCPQVGALPVFPSPFSAFFHWSVSVLRRWSVYSAASPCMVFSVASRGAPAAGAAPCVLSSVRANRAAELRRSIVRRPYRTGAVFARRRRRRRCREP